MPRSPLRTDTDQKPGNTPRGPLPSTGLAEVEIRRFNLQPRPSLPCTAPLLPKNSRYEKCGLAPRLTEARTARSLREILANSQRGQCGSGSSIARCRKRAERTAHRTAETPEPVQYAPLSMATTEPRIPKPLKRCRPEQMSHMQSVRFVDAALSGAFQAQEPISHTRMPSRRDQSTHPHSS